MNRRSSKLPLDLMQIDKRARPSCTNTLYHRKNFQISFGRLQQSSWPEWESGYNGIGPFVGKGCSYGYKGNGALCRNVVRFVGRGKYGRGVGKPLGCTSGWGKGGALCHLNCKSGYKGVGPRFLQLWPSFFKKHGAYYQNIRRMVVEEANLRRTVVHSVTNTL